MSRRRRLARLASQVSMTQQICARDANDDVLQSLAKYVPWSPRNISGMTSQYDDKTLTAPHVVGEGVWGTVAEYPKVDSWNARYGASAPALSQATDANRPDERGEVFEAAKRKGPYFKVGRWLDAASHSVFDDLHGSEGSTLVCVFVMRAQEAGIQTLLMTRAESASGGPGVWLYNDGLYERVGFKVTNATAEIGAITCASGWRRGVNVVIARLDPNTGRVKLWLNGGTETSALWSASPASKNVASASLARLGASTTNSDNHKFNGEIFAINTYNRYISDSDCQKIFNKYSEFYPRSSATETPATKLYPQLSSPQRVFMIGDSLTAGYNATGNIGYASLVQSQSSGKYVMVGPYLNGTANTDGVSGWCIHSRDPVSGHAPSSTNAGRLSQSMLDTYYPDIIVFLAGVNSLRQWQAGNPALSERFFRNHGRDTKEIIKQMAQWRPSARFLVVAPTSGTPNFDYTFSESSKLMATGYGEIVADLRSSGIPVLMQNHSSIITSASQMSDPIHPNDLGHQVIASELIVGLDAVCGF